MGWFSGAWPRGLGGCDDDVGRRIGEDVGSPDGHDAILDGQE